MDGTCGDFLFSWHTYQLSQILGKHKISTGTDIRDVHRYPEIFTDISTDIGTDVGTDIRDIHRYRVAQIPGSSDPQGISLNLVSQ